MTIDQQRTDLAPDGILVAAINLGNPVLAQGNPDDPQGVTVDLAHEVARRLGVDVRFSCFDAARKSFAELTEGAATIAFLADEPARAAEVTFTRPYVLIDGVYAVPGSSSYRSPAEIDAPGVQIGVKQGSAYDLFLTRTLQHATIVRGADGTTVFGEQGLDVAAGIREPVTAYVGAHPDLRLIDEPFMQIRQSVATRRTADPATTSWLNDLLDELLAGGFVREALRASGQLVGLAAGR
ncbi:transporter substrate-binding domain-containing protein [Flexivirga oryzae]|uniref:Polar amino acid transport system substrate-binding protein n=1 Tax=Flexivirga oryzae TaxID=1794944 RepID=A0A839NBK8_9MICO|nr:transporter substrate-binding domain-containing protein [Flexivirga oryzae]MBB2894597.1 polar amino acid transport system substrate-binding protein [Flexivirga oryzae]